MGNKTNSLLLASWLLLSGVEGRLILPQDYLGIFSQDKALDCQLSNAGIGKDIKQ